MPSYQRHRDQHRDQQLDQFPPRTCASPARSARRSSAACRWGVTGTQCGLSGRQITHFLVEFRGAGYGIVPTRGPGVAAQQPPGRQPRALGAPVHLDGPQRVRRAAGVVAADVAVQRADRPAGTAFSRPISTYLMGSPAGTAPPTRRRRGRRAVAAGVASGRGQGAHDDVDTRPGCWPSRSAARCRSRRFTAVSAHRRADRLGDHETDPDAVERRLGAADRRARTRVGRATRTPRRTVRRKSSALRILDGAGNTDPPSSSGGQLGATLAPPGGEDGASGAGPHPEPEAVGAAAAPIARLEGALAHGRSPTFSNLMLKSEAPRRNGGAGRIAGSHGDLLTVRGPTKRVKPGDRAQTPSRTRWPYRSAASIVEATRRIWSGILPERVAGDLRGC